jgi:hypothetical protein
MRKREKIAALHEAVNEYVTLYGLTGWDIDVYIQSPNDDSTAKTMADWEYERGTIVFTPEEIPEAEIRRFARHEVGHLMLWPLMHAAEFCAGDDKAKQEMVRLALELVATKYEKAPFWDIVDHAATEEIPNLQPETTGPQPHPGASPNA